MNGLFCAEKEETEGLAEVMDREFKQETTLGPCNATGEKPESSEAANGEKTVV